MIRPFRLGLGLGFWTAGLARLAAAAARLASLRTLARLAGGFRFGFRLGPRPRRLGPRRLTPTVMTLESIAKNVSMQKNKEICWATPSAVKAVCRNRVASLTYYKPSFVGVRPQAAIGLYGGHGDDCRGYLQSRDLHCYYTCCESQLTKLCGVKSGLYDEREGNTLKIVTSKLKLSGTGVARRSSGWELTTCVLLEALNIFIILFSFEGSLCDYWRK